MSFTEKENLITDFWCFFTRNELFLNQCIASDNIWGFRAGTGVPLENKAPKVNLTLKTNLGIFGGFWG